MIDLNKIEQGARLILEGLGVDLTDHNFETTPARVAKVFQEIYSPQETNWPVFDENYTDVVVMKGHEFWTFCPHHLLPVRLTASVAYIPDGHVLGASKLVRIFNDVNYMPKTQEALTKDAVDLLMAKSHCTGAAVMLEGEHGCFRMRGAKSSSTMRTLKFAGLFSAPEMQRRFMELIA